MIKERSIHDLSTSTRKKITKVLEEKGVPHNYDGHVYRTDSDSYSHGMDLVIRCLDKGLPVIFELRSGSDDVYFWFLPDDEKEILKKFTQPGVTFQRWEDEDGYEDDEEEDTE